MVQISNRLQAVARLVTTHQVVADVGCDHGYIPVYLIETGQISRAIAMDVNPGPLSRAKEHIIQYQLQDVIELRLSDGVQALQPGEASAVVIAGMGGGLVKKILTEGEQVLQQTEELILQPQSELSRVRAFLRENGYRIVAEDMVLEDGKYYPMMRVVHGTQKVQADDMMQQVENLYGPELLAKKHPVLQNYLAREASQQAVILQQLQKQVQTEKIQNRLHELEKEMQLNQTARRIAE